MCEREFSLYDTLKVDELCPRPFFCFPVAYRNIVNSYLASLARVHPVVEPRGLVAAHPAEHLVVAVELWNEERETGKG